MAFLCVIRSLSLYLHSVILYSDLNLPLTGVAFGLVFIFLKVRTPEGSIKAKLQRVDWTYVYDICLINYAHKYYDSGNAIVIAGTTLAVVGLTFGGIRFPWNSAQVLAPLLIGLALIGVFFLYEAKIPREPTIPWEILNNRTTIGG